MKTIHHIISYCSKLAQKEYKARHEWVGMVIHWEMCKKFEFDHANKWYMHNPAPVLETDTHKLLWDFDIQMDHLISARRPDLIIINKKKKKKNLQDCRLCCPGRPQNKTERMCLHLIFSDHKFWCIVGYQSFWYAVSEKFGP